MRLKKIAFILMISFLSLLAILFSYLKFYDFVISSTIEKSSVPLEIVFLASPKDFEVLPYSVASVKKYLKQPIEKMVLVAPNTEESKELAKSLNMKYINEDDLLKLSTFTDWIKSYNLTNNYNNSRKKWSWYYQQFLKLLYYKLASTDYYLVID